MQVLIRNLTDPLRLFSNFSFYYRLLPQAGKYGGVVFNITIYNTSMSKDVIFIVGVVPETVQVNLKVNVSKKHISILEDSDCTSSFGVRVFFLFCLQLNAPFLQTSFHF